MSNYLIIDKRTFVGNDVLFWNKNGSGYTTSIDQAQKYSEKEAMSLDAGRVTDIAIAWDDVEKHSRRVVDFQNLDRDIFRSGYSCFQTNNSKDENENKIEILNNKINSLERLFDKCEYWIDEYGAPPEDAINTMREEAQKIINEKLAI